MEHHHHHIDDESNEVVSTIISDIVDDEESHLKVVSQYQITDNGEDSNHDGLDNNAIPIDESSNGLSAIAIDTKPRSLIDSGLSKRGSVPWKNGTGLSNYRQKYKKMWESVPELKDWLLPFSADPYSAFCKYCRCQLHAHKKGLLSHAKSSKHKKLLPDCSIDLSRAKNQATTLDSLSSATTQTKRSICTFNDNWLKDPFFKPWLRKIPANRFKALCIACRSILVAGRSELVKHSLVAKHKKAISEGFNVDCSDLDLSWLSPDFHPTSNQPIVSMSGLKSSEGDSNNSMGLSDGVSLTEVVDRLNQISPIHLAEPWDNVGLLVRPSKPSNVRSILITNDLTESVMEEAIEKNVNLIISYHPPIFRPLKRLAGGSWKESIITACIESRVALFSPHTALDAVKGGINDWLIESFGELAESKPITQSTCNVREDSNYPNCVDLVAGPELTSQLANLENIVMTVKNNEYESGGVDVRICCKDETLPKLYSIVNQHGSMAQNCSKLIKIASPPLPGVGMGRVGKLKDEISIREAIKKVKARLGIEHVRLALSPNHSLETKVLSFAVCAGSGFSIVSQAKSDVIVTGEMSHHEVLDCIHEGSTVVLTEHSNSERGFLSTVYAENLRHIFGSSVSVITSTSDTDPLKVF